MEQCEQTAGWSGSTVAVCVCETLDGLTGGSVASSVQEHEQADAAEEGGAGFGDVGDADLGEADPVGVSGIGEDFDGNVAT